MNLLMTILPIVVFICAVWIIYDVFTSNKKLPDSMKILWVVLAIFLNIISAIVYYLLYKK